MHRHVCGAAGGEPASERGQTLRAVAYSGAMPTTAMPVLTAHCQVLAMYRTSKWVMTSELHRKLRSGAGCTTIAIVTSPNTLSAESAAHPHHVLRQVSDQRTGRDTAQAALDHAASLPGEPAGMDACHVALGWRLVNLRKAIHDSIIRRSLQCDVDLTPLAMTAIPQSIRCSGRPDSPASAPNSRLLLRFARDTDLLLVSPPLT